jgi:urease accessory protein UreF
VIDSGAPVCEMPRTRRSTVEPRLTFAVVTAVCCRFVGLAERESLSYTSVSIALAAFERAARWRQDAQARGNRLLAAMDAATGLGISAPGQAALLAHALASAGFIRRGARLSTRARQGQVSGYG